MGVGLRVPVSLPMSRGGPSAPIHVRTWWRGRKQRSGSLQILLFGRGSERLSARPDLECIIKPGRCRGKKRPLRRALLHARPIDLDARRLRWFADAIASVAMTHEELARRLELLKIEHRDLDSAITALSLAAVPDALAIARLKKRKLRLRDEIGWIEDRLIPDIIA